MENNENKKYCCITCGAETDELFHRYKENVIKIIHCKYCQQPADPYIEVDDLLVFIDFLLLKLRAHRHVLFNIDKIKYSLVIKLLCALIFANAYVKWFHLKNDQFQSILNHDHHSFYSLEYGFYWKLFESLIEYTIRFGFLLIIAVLRWRQAWSKEKTILLLRALILSSIGQLFVLPLLIWIPDHRDYYGILICFIFTTLCHAQALNASRLLSPIVSFLSLAIAIVLSKVIVSFLSALIVV